MAQSVGYFEDNVTFTEGPFVICNPLGNGWRIEVELKDGVCPILPDGSIYDLVKVRYGLAGKTNSHELITKICDDLNQLVKDNQIVLVGKSWRHLKEGEIVVDGQIFRKES